MGKLISDLTKHVKIDVQCQIVSGGRPISNKTGTTGKEPVKIRGNFWSDPSSSRLAPGLQPLRLSRVQSREFGRRSQGNWRSRFGRAASRGTLAPELPRATGVGPQRLRISNLLFGILFLIFFEIRRLPRDLSKNLRADIDQT